MRNEPRNVSILEGVKITYPRKEWKKIKENSQQKLTQSIFTLLYFGLCG